MSLNDYKFDATHKKIFAEVAEELGYDVDTVKRVVYGWYRRMKMIIERFDLKEMTPEEIVETKTNFVIPGLAYCYVTKNKRLLKKKLERVRLSEEIALYKAKKLKERKLKLKKNEEEKFRDTRSKLVIGQDTNNNE